MTNQPAELNLLDQIIADAKRAAAPSPLVGDLEDLRDLMSFRARIEGR